MPQIFGVYFEASHKKTRWGASPCPSHKVQSRESLFKVHRHGKLFLLHKGVT